MKKSRKEGTIGGEEINGVPSGEAAKNDVSRKKGKKNGKNGARNLLILGLGAILVATTTTTISLVIYHNSGDIYLDRSRPGFLPDEAEVEQDNAEEEDDYDFETNGDIMAEGLEEYLQHLRTEVELVDAYDEPFGEGALSDERLDIADDTAGV